MKRLVCAVVAAGLLTFSCGDSGQTGSADCAPVPLSCECDSLAGKSLVKGTLITLDSNSMSLEIEQVLNPNTLLGEGDVQRHVVGPLAQSLACDRTRLELPHVGDSVFASFYAYVDHDPTAALNVGEALVVPWSAAVDVGNGGAIPVSEAVMLSDPETCEAQHPRPSMPPCNDTSSVWNCSVAHGTPQHSGTSSWPAVGLLGFGVLLMRRSRVGPQNAKRPLEEQASATSLWRHCLSSPSVLVVAAATSTSDTTEGEDRRRAGRRSRPSTYELGQLSPKCA